MVPPSSDKKVKSAAAAAATATTNSSASTQTGSSGSVNTSKLSEKSNGPLVYTPLSEIPKGIERLTRAFHEKQKTHSIQFRLNQLRNLYFLLKDNSEALCDALSKDFNRSPSETRNLELAGATSELLHAMSSLHKWVKPEKVTDLPLTASLNPVYIERIPLGVVLIISPFNYPFLLSFNSIAGAIAGGNAVVFKPSESTPHYSQLFTSLLTQALDPDIFYAVNGAIPETTVVLDQKFDKIMYTGNNTVGTIVAKKAAETLTPVLLELGGKSPAFILDDVKDSDLKAIANRIVWGRFANAGQTCVAVDYVLVHESVKQKLISKIESVIKEDFYPNLTKDDPSYTHLIHNRAFNNLSKILDTTKGDIIVGGERDSASNYISPTVVDNVDWNDSTMQQELFGPVLPIITYSNLADAVTEVVRRHDTPLAQYIFTSGATSPQKNEQVNLIFKSIRSGALLVNDVLMHVALANAPFGGIGQSGLGGGYHGFFSFRTFTHERTVMENDLKVDFALASRYPPYSSNKDGAVSAALIPYNDVAWFNRTDDVRINGPNPIWGFFHTIAGVGGLVSAFINSRRA